MASRSELAVVVDTRQGHPAAGRTVRSVPARPERGGSMLRRASTGRGSAVASLGGAGISGRAQTESPLHHITMATFPAEVQAPIQYGTNVGAAAVDLVGQQLLPLTRACEVMRDLLGVLMSEGTVWELIKRCAGQLASVEQQIKEALIQSEVIHQDETGLYLGGIRHWMHVTCTPSLTHYHVDKSRGQVALEAIGILPQFTGI